MHVNSSGIFPSWIRPSFVMPGGALEVSAGVFAETISGIRLSGAGSEMKLPVARRAGKTIFCIIPGDAREGFFGLEVQTESGKSFFSPNSVKVIRGFRKNFTFFHISDFHLNRHAPDKLEKLAGIINRRGPEFVINTGDIIDRYENSPQNLLPPPAIRRQVEHACNTLLKLRAPMFLSPGNHDLALPWYRGLWNEYGHNAFTGRIGDYSFDYGRFRFICLDASLEYDEKSFAGKAPGFSDEQLLRFAGAVKEAGEGIMKILFFHYDYGERLRAVLRNLKVDAVFYGHSKKKPRWMDGDFVNGHMGEGIAYQEITAGDSGIKVIPGPMFKDL